MGENRTQDSQPTAVDMLELTEQVLKLKDQVDNLADQMLNYAIPTEPESEDACENWTIERFGALVPRLLRERYEAQNRNGELYRLGAELKNFIQEQRWELTLQFAIKHIFFFCRERRLFGINLFSTRPRLTFFGITEETAQSIVPECDFTSYPTQYSQLVCHRGPEVADLRDLFEFIYHNNCSSQL